MSPLVAPTGTGKPTVAIVSDAIHPFHRGGKELRYYELSRRLSEDAEVHIYTMHWWDGPSVRKLGDVTLHAICPLIPLYAKGRRSIFQALVFAAACLRLLTQRFDVIEADHIPFFQLLTLKIVSVLRRRRLVATWHEVWGDQYWRHYLGLPGLAASLIEKIAMRAPDSIVAASPETGLRLKATLGDRTEIVVVPNGIDLAAARKAPVSPNRSCVTVVGRQLKHKRVDLLLEAIAILRRSHRDVTCRIIGDGPENGNLVKQAESLGVGDLVDFQRNVQTQGHLYSLLKASDIFVFPSEREGFGIAALEAMACGLPVITTSTPDNLSQFLVARSTRNIVCEPTSLAIARTIEEVIESGKANLTTDRVVESWIAEYDWDYQARAVSYVLFGGDCPDPMLRGGGRKVQRCTILGGKKYEDGSR